MIVFMLTFCKITPSSISGEGGNLDDMTLWRQKRWVPWTYTMLFGLFCVTVMEWPSRSDLSLVTFVAWLIPSDFLRRYDETTHCSQQSTLFASGFKFLISWGVFAWNQNASGLPTLLVSSHPLPDLGTQLGLLHVHPGWREPGALELPPSHPSAKPWVVEAVRNGFSRCFSPPVCLIFVEFNWDQKWRWSFFS